MQRPIPNAAIPMPAPEHRAESARRGPSERSGHLWTDCAATRRQTLDLRRANRMGIEFGARAASLIQQVRRRPQRECMNRVLLVVLAVLGWSVVQSDAQKTRTPTVLLLPRAQRRHPPWRLRERLSLRRPDEGVFFGLDGDGTVEQVAWPRGGQVAFIALDRDGSGRIETGSESIGA